MEVETKNQQQERNGNIHRSNPRNLRRRRALHADEASNREQEEGQRQLELERDPERENWERLHCRISGDGGDDSNSDSGWRPAQSSFLPEDGLSSPDSIATDYSLLGPILSAVGMDFCADEPVVSFQHFRFYEQHIGAVSKASNSDSVSSSGQLTVATEATTEAFVQPSGWYVNCCDVPQLPAVEEELASESDLEFDPSQIVASEDVLHNTSDTAVDASGNIVPGTSNVPVIGTNATIEGQYDETCPKYKPKHNESYPGPWDPEVEGMDHPGMRAAHTEAFFAIVAACMSLGTILAMTLPLTKKRKRSRASTYNLYLVFLAVPDLVYNTFLAVLFLNFEESTCLWSRKTDSGKIPLIDHPIDLALFTTCASATLYMNAIIAYEILKLLRNSKRRKRSKAPTLRLAIQQAACAYLLGVVIFCVDNYAGDYIKEQDLPLLSVGLVYFLVACGIPILYLLWVCFRIYWETLIGDTRSKAGKRLTILVRYFSRIIIVYICIWLPAIILYWSQWDIHSKNIGNRYFAACLMYSLAAWANFFLSLTKPDVRKHFIELFTCEVLLPEPDCSTEKKKPVFNIAEKDKKTTSTGEETLNAKPPSPKEKPEEEEIDCGPPSMPDDSENVFDFDGADAPRLRETMDKKTSIIFSVLPSLPRFASSRSNLIFNSNQSNNIGSSRTNGDIPYMQSELDMKPQSSFVIRNNLSYVSSGRESVSEPFRKSFDASLTHSRFSITSQCTDENPSNSLGGSEQLKTLSEQPIKREWKATEDGASEMDRFDMEATTMRFNNATSTVPTSIVSKTSNASSERASTIAFFMDRESLSLADTTSDDLSSINSDPKHVRWWIADLRKNIRSMKRLMKKGNMSEQQRSIYRQSMALNQRALEVAKGLEISIFNHASDQSESENMLPLNDSGSKGNEVDRPSNASNLSYPSALSSLTFGSFIPNDDSSSSDEEEDGSETFTTSGDDTTYSKQLWIVELRTNIRDLNLQLENKDIPEVEREMLNRAVDSQRTTLASIEITSDNTDTVSIASFSRISTISRQPYAASQNHPKSFEHGKNSAGMKVPLDVIQDETSSFDEED